MGYSLIETPCVAIVTSNKNVTEFSSICYSSLVTHTSFLEWNCLQWNCEELAQGPCLIRRLLLQVGNWYYQLRHVPDV